MKPQSLSSHALSIERGDLNYVSDAEPGIRRRKSGRGFTYLCPDGGGRLTNGADLARIRSLAIPPAWTDVWICSDPAGHIQATGRDDRGRKQYRYHPIWLICQDEAKFSNLIGFAEVLPRIRAAVDADLRRHGLPRERVIASIVWLLDHTMIRIGNDEYRRENRSFGLTTLRTRHLEIEGTQMKFAFLGKSGQEWKLKLTDRRIARIIGEIQELPGQHLFQYLDEEEKRHPIQSQDVNDYIRAAAGNEFTSKHFRTWGATLAAAMLLQDADLPDSKRAAARVMNSVIDTVSKRLRNTRSVCRKCYVHPAVISAWEEGRLPEELATIRRRSRKPLAGLDADESVVLRWLRAQTAS